MGPSIYATGWAATLLILLTSWAVFPVKGRHSKEGGGVGEEREKRACEPGAPGRHRSP